MAFLRSDTDALLQCRGSLSTRFTRHRARKPDLQRDIRILSALHGLVVLHILYCVAENQPGPHVDIFALGAYVGMPLGCFLQGFRGRRSPRPHGCSWRMWLRRLPALLVSAYRTDPRLGGIPGCTARR